MAGHLGMVKLLILPTCRAQQVADHYYTMRTLISVPHLASSPKWGIAVVPLITTAHDACCPLLMAIVPLGETSNGSHLAASFVRLVHLLPHFYPIADNVGLHGTGAASDALSQLYLQLHTNLGLGDHQVRAAIVLLGDSYPIHSAILHQGVYALDRG